MTTHARSVDQHGVEDQIDRAFPDRAFTHLISLSGSDQLGLAQLALARLRWLGASPDALSLTATAAGDIRIRVSGLSSRAARRLTDQLAAAPATTHAAVEHVLLRGQAETN